VRRWVGGLLRRWADRIDPGADRITFKLSDGHGWVRPATIEAFGEDGLKRLLGVDHIHPVPDDKKADEE
jgi:hypothetical protein